MLCMHYCINMFKSKDNIILIACFFTSLSQYIVPLISKKMIKKLLFHIITIYVLLGFFAFCFLLPIFISLKCYFMLCMYLFLCYSTYVNVSSYKKLFFLFTYLILFFFSFLTYIIYLLIQMKIIYLMKKSRCVIVWMIIKTT